MHEHVIKKLICLQKHKMTKSTVHDVLLLMRLVHVQCYNFKTD